MIGLPELVVQKRAIAAVVVIVRKSMEAWAGLVRITVLLRE
jgi:hypothetical protein